MRDDNDLARLYDFGEAEFVKGYKAAADEISSDMGEIIRGHVAERDRARSTAMALEEQLAIAEGLLKRLAFGDDQLVIYADSRGQLWDAVEGCCVIDVSDAEAALLSKLTEEPAGEA